MFGHDHDYEAKSNNVLSWFIEHVFFFLGFWKKSSSNHAVENRSIEKISASICRKRERRENRDMTSKLIFLFFPTMLADSFGKHLTRHRYEEVLTELPEEEKTLVKVRTDFDEEKKHF